MSSCTSKRSPLIGTVITKTPHTLGLPFSTRRASLYLKLMAYESKFDALGPSEGGSPLLQQGELDFSPAAEILAHHGLSAPAFRRLQSNASSHVAHACPELRTGPRRDAVATRREVFRPSRFESNNEPYSPGISAPAHVRPLIESSPFLIETPKRLKIAVTHYKQKGGMHSNRVEIAPPFDRFFSLGTRRK